MIRPQAVSHPHCPVASATVQGSCSRCPCALSFAEGHPALSWPLLLPVAHLGRGARGRGTPHHPRDELPSLRCLRWRLHRRRAASSRLRGERFRFAGHRSCAAPSSCLCFGDERPLTRREPSGARRRLCPELHVHGRSFRRYRARGRGTFRLSECWLKRTHVHDVCRDRRRVFSRRDGEMTKGRASTCPVNVKEDSIQIRIN